MPKTVHPGSQGAHFPGSGVRIPYFRQGVLVRVRSGGRIWKRFARGDLEAWLASPDSKGVDSAGELNRPPKDFSKAPSLTALFRISDPRIKAPRGYGYCPHCAELLDESRVLWYVRRLDLF